MFQLIYVGCYLYLYLCMQVPLLEPGDIIIDGGNSEYTDTTVLLLSLLLLLLLSLLLLLLFLLLLAYHTALCIIGFDNICLSVCLPIHLSGAVHCG